MKTDWLASDTIFYNTKTKLISQNINDVIDFNHFEWHPEGLYNYLDFGYSILEQTPLKYVKFLPHSTKIFKDSNGNIKIEKESDQAEKWLGIRSDEQDVLHLIEKKIRAWEDSVEGEIIIPTSGGFDSRLLNLMIGDKSRIRSFTYGLSTTQSKSYEVVYARKISEIFNTKWNFIPLGNYHNYFDEWYNQYGISTHAHGMYHIEFYKNILALVDGANPFLSGIVGDAWSGRVDIADIRKIHDLSNLGYSHGLNADTSFIKLSVRSFKIREDYYSRNIKKFAYDYWKIIESMRFKLLLLSYLMKMPQMFGFKPYSPFLDIDVALGMLSLSDGRKKDRIWQTDFFKKHNLHLESLNLNCSYQNNLNYQASLKDSLKPLSEDILSEIIKPEYVRWINKNTLQTFYQKNRSRLYYKLRNKKIVWRLQPTNTFDLRAYSAYLTLYPLQKIIQQREEYFRR